MPGLLIFSNRHIKNEALNVQKNDTIVLENRMSRNRWSLFFRKNKINEALLNITYITQEEYFNLTGIKFDAIVGNPPYKGKAALHQQFFNKAVDLVKDGGTVSFIQPATPYFNKKEKKKQPEQEMINNISKYYPQNPKTP